MKTVLISILLCAVLHVISISAAACNTTLEQESCCKIESCVFVNCSSEANSTGCFESIAAANCSNPNELFDKCTQEEGYCIQFNDAPKNCCHEANCSFYNCSAEAKNESVCAAGNITAASKVCPQANASLEDIYCSGLTTNAPTTTVGPAETCEIHNTTFGKCCEASGCAFFNCIGATNSTVCKSNTTTKDICGSGDVPSSDQCKQPTTTSTTVPQSTGIPASTTPSTGDDNGQRFDAASFIGGIVLCAGLVAIAYFGLKFYRARQERNYHTL